MLQPISSYILCSDNNSLGEYLRTVTKRFSKKSGLEVNVLKIK